MTGCLPINSKTCIPRSKPSIVRMGKNGKSLNTLENTLQNSVINAAGDRVNDYNASAAEKDLAAHETRLIEKLEKKLSSSDEYDQVIKDIFEFERVQAGLIVEGHIDEQEAVLPRMPAGSHIDLEIITQFASREIIENLKDLTFLLLTLS